MAYWYGLALNVTLYREYQKQPFLQYATPADTDGSPQNDGAARLLEQNNTSTLFTAQTLNTDENYEGGHWGAGHLWETSAGARHGVCRRFQVFKRETLCQ